MIDKFDTQVAREVAGSGTESSRKKQVQKSSHPFGLCFDALRVNA